MPEPLAGGPAALHHCATAPHPRFDSTDALTLTEVARV